MSSKNKLNEETLKNIVLVPYLATLSLSADQLTFEHGFRVRIGRSVRAVARGRADVVVKNSEGRSLFVVELKATDVELTEDDRDQAVSYARLLKDIAPFVVLSNGKVTKIYDSITYDELRPEDFHTTSKFYSSGRKLLTTEDMQIRWEALQKFVGYSRDNVTTFTRAQTESRIRPLLGHDGDGKYVPALYVRREPLREAFTEFLSTPSSVFVLLGESGVGKTNEMCNLAESISATNLALFFTASSLSDGLGHALVEEFNWEFSQQLQLPEVVKRLEQLSRATGAPTLIFVDAADEIEDAHSATRLSEFVQHLRGTDGTVRLVVSLKASEWPRFAKHRDIPTAVSLAAEDGWLGSPDRNEGKWKGGAPFVLGEFSAGELVSALEKYESHFHLPTMPEGELKAKCRLPFFLRVVGEAYGDGAQPLPLRISRGKLVERWLDLKFAKMTSPDRARRDLIRVASTVCDLASDTSNQDASPIDHVQESALGHELLDEELVKHNVLVRITDHHRRVAFRFYHSQILYYAIARWVLKLDTLTPEAFEKALPRLFSSPVLEGALFWHLDDGASAEHLGVMHRALNARAAVFLKTYEDILERVIPGLVGRMSPHTTAPLGIAYVRERGGVGYYGLFPVDGTTRGRVVEINSADDINEAFDALRAVGCPEPVGDPSNFGRLDPATFAADLALKHLRRAVTTGSLDESVYVPLLIESVLAICSQHAKRLGLHAAPDQRLRIASLLPLDLHDVRVRVQVLFGMSHAEVRWMREQEQTRSKYFTPSPGGGGSLDLSGFDQEAVARDVTAAAIAGKEYAPCGFHDARELDVLPSLIRALADKGVSVISDTPSPPPDHIPTNYWSMIAPYSEPKLIELIKTIFSEGFIAYERLVERNLPGVKERLHYYPHRPLTAVASFKRDPEGPPQRYLGHLQWGVYHTETASETLPWVTTDPPPTEMFDLRTRMPAFDPPRGLLSEPLHRSNGDLTHIVYPSDAVGWPGATGVTSARYTPIRAFAYMLLSEDVKKLTSGHILEALTCSAAHGSTDLQTSV